MSVLLLQDTLFFFPFFYYTFNHTVPRLKKDCVLFTIWNSEIYSQMEFCNLKLGKSIFNCYYNISSMFSSWFWHFEQLSTNIIFSLELSNLWRRLSCSWNIFKLLSFRIIQVFDEVPDSRFFLLEIFRSFWNSFLSYTMQRLKFYWVTFCWHIFSRNRI